MNHPQQAARRVAFLFAAAAAVAWGQINPETLPAGVVGVAYNQVLTAGAPVTSWLVQGALPDGLAGNQMADPADGTIVFVISGTPTRAGSFTFVVRATTPVDPEFPQPTLIVRQYTVVITGPASSGPLIQVSTTSLAFTGLAFGESTGVQFVLVTSTSANPVNFTISVDDGANGPAPDWIVPFPLSGTTPARISVFANPGMFQAGTYTNARMNVLATGSTSPLRVAFTMRLTSAAAKLDVFPRTLRFVRGSSQEQALVLRNAGGGGTPIAYRATVLNNSSWLSLTPAAGQFTGATQVIRVTANATGQTLGGLRDTIRISSATGDLDIAVFLLISPAGPIIQVGSTGARFTIRQNNGIVVPQSIQVFNSGSPGSTVNWSAAKLLAPGAPDALNVSTAAGRSTVGTPSSLTFSPQANAATLPVGAYYTLLIVSDPNALNSPQYVAVIVEVAAASSTAVPELSPASMIFTATANSASQTATLSVGNTAALAFQVASNTYDGNRWLTASPASGTVNTQNPATISIGVNAAGRAPGVYFGEVDVTTAGQVRAIFIVLVVLPAGASAAEPEKSRAVTGCTPTRIVIAPGIIGSFSLPASWPSSLNARLLDDCGTALPGGSVVARFDNGDSPLTLEDYAGSGSYLATWTPTFPAANVTITLVASAPTFAPATLRLGGAVNTNAFAPPQLFDGGTVNNTNPLGGALLAPGTVTAAYGQNLAASTVSPGVIPLVKSFNGTSLIMGGISAPLYFLSGGQLNVQAPVELPVNQQVSVAATVNNAFAVLPKPVVMVAAAPGISSFPDTKIIAQHADFTLVDSAKPSKAGESIVTYVSGMGSTTPGVASGIQTPNQLTPAKIIPTVTVNGVPATILYAGLTPGGIGLYQINFTVPPGTARGDATVVITQNGVIANVTKLPVGAP